MIEDLEKYKQYAKDVLAGNIIACKYVKLACSRYLSWFDRDDIYFDPEAADRPVNFIQKLKQYQGKWAGQNLILEDWQKFFIYGIYGWKSKENNKRIVRHARLEIARKNGKSTLIAGLSLYHLIAEGKGAGEVDIVALTRSQAKILFDMCSNISKRMDPSGKHIHQTINRVKYPKYDSFIQVLASESAGNDGYSSSVAIMDEAHNQKDSKLFDVLLSSQASREEPLSLLITSSGYLLNGFYYSDVRPNIINMLNGIVEQDSLFGLIYTLDEDDSIEDESVWIKANPNLGVSVSVGYLRDRIAMIKSQPSSRVDVETKNFSRWLSSKDVWIPDDLILKYMKNIDLNLFKDIKNIYACGGIDLASTEDLTSFSILFNHQDRFYFKTWYFLPHDTIEKSPKSVFYKKCVAAGDLIETPGDVTDYDYVLNKILEVNKKIKIYKIGYDTRNATQFTINCTQSHLSMIPFSQLLASFNNPTKQFEILLKQGKVIIDKNPITRWCFQNSTLKYDHMGNCKPIKGSGKNNKVDGLISILESLGIMIESKPFQSFFKAL